MVREEGLEGGREEGREGGQARGGLTPSFPAGDGMERAGNFGGKRFDRPEGASGDAGGVDGGGQVGKEGRREGGREGGEGREEGPEAVVDLIPSGTA
jgi:hypothetical protein